MAERTGTREIARAKKRAAAAMKKAERHLEYAEDERKCSVRSEHALQAFEFATHAASEASGYKTFRLPQALRVQAAARRIIASCTKKR